MVSALRAQAEVDGGSAGVSGCLAQAAGDGRWVGSGQWAQAEGYGGMAANALRAQAEVDLIDPGAQQAARRSAGGQRPSILATQPASP